MAVALKERARQYRPVARPSVGPNELAAMCQRLEDRLLRGQERISAAQAAGEDVRPLERHWRELLRAYERVSQLLARRPALG